MSIYTIDDNNKQENCTKIPADTIELEIGYKGFKSMSGIGRANKLETITIIECKQMIHMDGVEECQNVKEIRLVGSPFANKKGLQEQKCRICADLSNTDYNTDYIPPNVSALKLVNCKLTQIPNLLAFSKLVEIRFGQYSYYEKAKVYFAFLLAKKNKFIAFDTACLPNELQVLGLSNCDLTEFPDLHSLNSLIELDLSCNEQIKKIQVERLPKQLQEINLRECDLVEFPDFHKLDSLIVFNLSENYQIHKIETERLPKQLQKLNLRECGLVEQPDLHCLDSLEELNLSQNEQIQKIEFERLPKHLQKLNLYYCGLVEQPDLHQLDTLIELDLSENKQIYKIEADRLPTNIQALNLSCTQVSSLLSLRNCTKLTELDVSDCKMNDINQLQVLKLMPELQKFSCYENDFCENENIKDALALVLTSNIKDVEIEYGHNIADEIKQLQTDLNKSKCPFTQTLDEMFDEQFYEDNKNIIIQLQVEVYAERSKNEIKLEELRKITKMREEVDKENCLIIRVLVGEE